MGLAGKQCETSPEFGYHLLRNALEGFSKNPGQLNPEAYREVYRRASKSFAIESLVLDSPEARKIIISGQQLDESIETLASRYETDAEFTQDLAVNDLDRESLRRAIYRELMFNSVMQRVAAKSADVSDMDVRLFYELHHERFETKEQRLASHILITINPDYPENTPAAAHERMEQIVDKLAGRSNRFGEFAKRYSECPTAIDGGRLGDISQGQLHSELDAMLFSMEENQISKIVESEMGLHILQCDRIRPAKRVPFSKAMPRIREFLQERQRRNCQKAWLAGLQQTAPQPGDVS